MAETEGQVPGEEEAPGCAPRAPEVAADDEHHEMKSILKNTDGSGADVPVGRSIHRSISWNDFHGRDLATVVEFEPR